MRIATLNIRHGGGKRVSKLLEHIARINPDILVLTEYRNDSSGEVLREALSREGLSCQASLDAGPRTNTVLIASPHQFDTEMFESELGVNGHRCLKAGFAQFDLYGLYFPNQEAKKPVFDFLNGLSVEVLNSRSLLLGDFNTGLHFQDEPGKTFLCADDLEELLQRGWVDAWRSRNPTAREFSWYSYAGNGFRLDQALASPSFNEIILSADYDHSPRETQATDHSALVLDCVHETQ